MELLSALSLLVLTAVTGVVMFWRQRWAVHINKLPGPKALPVLGNFLEMVLPREKVLKSILERNSKYGPIFRLWITMFPTVHVASPETMEPFLNSSVNIRKGITYNFLKPWLGEGLLTSLGKQWFQHRKLITPTFHFKILETFLDVFNENSAILVSQLEETANGKAFDICPFITRCALDIICETAMGTKISVQLTRKSKYLDSIHSISKLTMQRTFRVWLHPDIVFNNLEMGREYHRNISVVHGFTETIIRERKEQRKEKTQTIDEVDIGAKKREAFLDLLLDANGKDGNCLLTDLELREEVDTFMFEGHDTTTAGMSWTLFLLGHHPEIQQQAYLEQQEIFNDDLMRPATMRDLNEMKLLERIIKESLRLYPSVPYISRILQDDVQVGEYLIPARCAVVLHIFAMHRCPKLYPEPDKFDPDRFLPEVVQKRHPFAYVPFSAGPRNCIGQKFALIEEKVILSYIIRNYKIESVDKAEDVTLLGELVLRPQDGIRVKITKR